MFTEPDFSYARLGHGWRTERATETGAQRMELFGQTTPSTYGRVLALNQASSSESRNITYPLLCGLLVLEIQQHIYNFLLSSVQHILHDIDSDQFSLAPKLPLPELPYTSSKEWLSLAAHALEAPYISTQSVDLGLLVNMAGARRASAEDHLFLLTEDPQYFVTSLKEWKEHAEVTMHHNCNCCWRYVVGRMIGDAFSNYIFWHWIHNQLTNMTTLEKQLRRADCDRLRLHPRDEKMWLELMRVIQLQIDFHIALLRFGVKASPRMRNHYFTQKGDAQGLAVANPVLHHLTNAERRFDVLFNAIVCDDLRQLHGLNQLVQKVQHMMDTDAEANLLVDPWISSVFADLAMLSEMENRIKCLEPWASGWNINGLLCPKTSKYTKPAMDLIKLESKLRCGILEAVEHEEMLPALLEGMLNPKFEYPAAKQYNKKNLSMMQFCAVVLAKLWQEVEDIVFDTTELSVHQVIHSRLLQHRTRYRTPSFIPPPAPAPVPHALSEKSTNILRFVEGTQSSDAVTPVEACGMLLVYASLAELASMYLSCLA